LLNFSHQGTALDFLASFFLYPSIYGASCADVLAGFPRCAGGVLSGLSDYPLLVTATVGAATALVLSEPAAGPKRYSDPRWLILLIAVFLLIQLALTPWWFAGYIVMVLGPMALLSGIVAGDHWEDAWRTSSKLAFAASTRSPSISMPTTWAAPASRAAKLNRPSWLARSSHAL